MAKRNNTVWILLGVGVLAALSFTGGLVVTGMYSDRIKNFAMAVATAERGQSEINSGNILNNNPGDIMSNGVLNVYPTLQDGWNALYHQVGKMFDGSSAYYSPDMSIYQIGWIYADGTHDPGGATNWISNVSSFLGVSPNTTLSQLG